MEEAMRKLITCILCVVISLNIFSPASIALANSSEKLTVILVLDNSGSMKNSDPDNLRFTGVQIILRLLDPGDKFGLVLFSTQAHILTGGLDIAGKTSLEEMSFFKELISSKADGYTDINAALQKTAGLISTTTQENEKVVIVLLTDGKPEIQNPYPEYERETLELASTLDVPVMAIALTQSSQTSFLSELVQVTNGTLVYANDSSDLIGAFMQVLGEIKDRTVVGGKRSTTPADLEIDPSLAPYIDSATFIVAKSETLSVQMLNSDGSEVGIESLKFPRFTYVTLENPVGGMYAFRPQGMGEMQIWAILRSRLRAQIISPSQVHPAGTEMLVTVNLLEETAQGKFTKIIGEANFTAMITTPDGEQTSLDRFYDDGTHGDITANDGNYTRTFPDTYQTGNYQILVQGWKGAVPVVAEALIQVTQFPEIVVDAPNGNVDVMDGAIELKVHLKNEDPLNAPLIYAQVVSPSGKVEEIRMNGEGYFYKTEFTPVENGEHLVVFTTRDARYLGMEYQTETDHSFQVTLIPFVTVIANEVDLPASCLSRPKEIVATLAVNASDDGILWLSTTKEWSLRPDEINIKKGQQEVQISLNTTNELSESNLSVDLFLEGENKLVIQPGNRLVLNVDVPGVGERCRIPIQFGGGLLVLVLVGMAAVTRTRKATRPLPVGGTLRYWEIGKSDMSTEIDLTAFNKNALLIGSGATCDVMLTAAGLELEHALIVAKKTADDVEIFLEPVGEVQKGYGKQIAPFALRHGEIFRMGTREFQYLSDNGE
jgi:uncharacterized protein YegL